MFLYNTALDKAKSLKEGDMVSWKSSGATATGKVIHVMDYGTLDIKGTKFKLKGEKDNPAVLIQLYRDGKPTDIEVGHKMSSLTKSIEFDLFKHGSHNQSSHGRRGGGKGGSGGAGGSVESKPKPNTIMSNEFIDKTGNEVSNQMRDASISFSNELEGLEERAQTAKEIKTLNTAMDSVQSATKDFMSAKKLKGQEKIGKIQSGINKYESAMDKIQGLDIYRMDVEQVIQNAYSAIPEAIIELGIESSLDI